MPTTISLSFCVSGPNPRTSGILCLTYAAVCGPTGPKPPSWLRLCWLHQFWVWQLITSFSQIIENLGVVGSIVGWMRQVIWRVGDSSVCVCFTFIRGPDRNLSLGRYKALTVGKEEAMGLLCVQLVTIEGCQDLYFFISWVLHIFIILFCSDYKIKCYLLKKTFISLKNFVLTR